jgi:hypothetical protein
MKQYRFTPKQGKYLAYIHNYTLLHGRPPSEAEMSEYMGITPPAVHTMILGLAKHGLVSREPGVARSIRVLVPSEQLPGIDGTPRIIAVPQKPIMEKKPSPDDELIRPRDLVSMQDAAKMSGYSPVRMRALAAEGRFVAWLIGHSWITTRRHVEEFLQTDTDRKSPHG